MLTEIIGSSAGSLEPARAADGHTGVGGSRLAAGERRELALDALRGTRSVSELASERGVSRRFIAQQRDRARAAVLEAFEPEAVPGDVLGWIPVTKTSLKRVVVSAALNGHGSVRGICEHVEAVTGRSISEGGVWNILQEAVTRAEAINRAQDLRGIPAGAHDEIFSQGIPVLVGVEPESSFVYLLEASASRDEVSWWAALTDKHERQGLQPRISISDAARGLQAGVRKAFPDIELRGDVLHAQMQLSELMTYLENRAFGRLTLCEREERRMIRAKNRDQGQSHSKPLALARVQGKDAVELHDDLALLVRWMTEMLSLIGPALPERRELFDWILQEMRSRAPRSHRITPVVTYFQNQRDALLAFVPEIHTGLDRIAQAQGIPLDLVEAVYRQMALDPEHPHYEATQRRLYLQAPAAADALDEALLQLLEGVLRASSAVENINSILRGYFFLRRSTGPAFLKLLQFYLNHRRFRRSERPERVGRSPAELLTGRPHPHWLDMLGYPPSPLLN